MNEPFYQIYDIIRDTYINSKFNLDFYMFHELGDNHPGLFFSPDRIENSHEDGYKFLSKQKIFFHDQEPILFSKFNKDWIDAIHRYNKLETNHLLSNSEQNSIDKDMLLEKSGWHDFYWFSNGFLSLEWYRFYQYANYLESNWNPTKTFSSYNRILADRAHRLIISGYLIDKFNDKIILSCHSSDNIVIDQKLPNNHQLYVNAVKDKNIFLNTNNSISNNFSYTIDVDDFIDSFCHIVTERIFYENRIHLTEKIFRPIVCCRPFILASSPGALKYLKQYGFKTFDKFWSEDYDQINDHNTRLDTILEIISYIGSLNNEQILKMLDEMKEILIFNRNHFYNDFRKIIKNELWNNFNLAVLGKNNNENYYSQILNSLSPAEINFIKSYPNISDFLDLKAIDIYQYAISNLIGSNANPEIIRPYIRENVRHFVSFYRGMNYWKSQQR